MKLTTQQQLDVRGYLSKVTVVENTFDELYDHILTALEQEPASKNFDINKVKELISSRFAEMINTPAEVKQYKRINLFGGLAVFVVALVTYWLTMEPTVSFWDCGEFISSASKLQVGHQPGAPLFLMIGKLFSLLAMGNTAKIAYWVNFSAVLASAATIMFLFWTITALAAKIYRNDKLKTKTFNIIAAGMIGALAYTFSDTFWFSAVESEVYALSTLFTAVTFWAILKWEHDLNDRWLLFIAFVVGLSTGVHLLSLLTIPAVTLVYYFKKTQKQSLMGTIKAFLIGCVIVGLMQFFIIQYFVLFSAKTDLFFVNTFGLSFGSGAFFFILSAASLLAWGIYYTVKTKKYYLNMSLLCLVFLLFGFSSYFMILIRANAKTNINLSNPDNAFSLYNYLGRTNYISTPLIYGNTFDAKALENKQTGNTYRMGKDKYEVSGHTYQTTYDKNILFPRTYSQKTGHDVFYKQWMNLQDGETPGFFKNLEFFTSWQMGFMYWRYFLWNFSGRQNDIQGQGGIENGNWISGIKPLDALRLGSQQELPQSILTNEGHNVFYGLPLIFGIAGLCWLYRRDKQSALVVLTLFFFTGLAIILYLNQDPMQPRERDYAYVGSFYAFAIFIGFGVLAFKEILSRIAPAKFSLIAATVICFLAVPVLMGVQGWDDHNRAQKTTAADWAKNFLNSCAANAILFTNADNDTYPLWYAQEVEGFRTDVRVICIQFLPDEAYINQLKKQMNLSAPLPVTMAGEKYVEGVRDYLPFVDYGLTDSVELKDLFAVMTSDHQEDKVQMADGSYMNFLPTKKMKLTIDSDQVIQTHTVSAKDRDKIAPAMEWTFNKTYASKGDLAMLDILLHNNWKRPVYFSTHAANDTYIGLDKYLYTEGYSYRLLPLKTDKNNERDKSDQTNSDAAYLNVMNKMNFSSFKKATYIDLETRRVLDTTWELSNTLTSNLILEGKRSMAEHVMQKGMKQLPLRNYSVTDTLPKILTVQNLYALNHINEANQLAKETADYLSQEFRYVATLDPQYQQAHLQNIRIGLYVLSGLDKVTEAFGQNELNRLIKSNFKSIANEFGIKV